jgi:hypothetical protein
MEIPRKTNRIMKILDSELWKAQSDQLFLRIDGNLFKCIIIFSVLDQILETAETKRSEKTISIRSHFSDCVVFFLDVIYFGHVDIIILIFLVKGC